MLLWSKITFCLLYRVELYLCFAETIRHKKYEFAYHQYALQLCIVTIYKVISPSRFHSHFPIEKVTDRYFCYRLSCIYILFVCLFVCFKKSGQICVATTDPRKGFCGESKLKKIEPEIIFQKYINDNRNEIAGCNVWMSSFKFNWIICNQSGKIREFVWVLMHFSV